MKNQNKKQHKKKGQMTVEMVLILSVLILLTYKVKEKLFDPAPPDNVFYQFISGPWKAVLVMMESGVWVTGQDARERGRKNHPNNFKRIYSEKGQDLN